VASIILEDIPLWLKPVTAICIHHECQAAISRALKFLYNGKSRYICRRYNIIRHLLSNVVTLIDFVMSKDHLTDPFTKYLSRECINYASKRMRAKSLTIPSQLNKNFT